MSGSQWSPCRALARERRYSRAAAYGQSKLANLLFTYELQRRLAHQQKNTIAVAAPGRRQDRACPPPARVCGNSRWLCPRRWRSRARR